MLTSPKDWDVLNAKIDRDHRRGNKGSDHDSLYAELSLLSPSPAAARDAASTVAWAVGAAAMLSAVAVGTVVRRRRGDRGAVDDDGHSDDEPATPLTRCLTTTNERVLYHQQGDADVPPVAGDGAKPSGMDHGGHAGKAAIPADKAEIDV